MRCSFFTKSWHLVAVAVLSAGCLSSCSNDDDDEPGDGSIQSSNTVYSDNPVDFPRTLLVASIETPSSKMLFTYDDSNRITEMKTITSYSSGSEYTDCYTYEWNGSECTVFRDGRRGDYKGYFTNGLLTKVVWDEYTITNVTFDGRHLVKGSNGYNVTWDENGNISAYSDGGYTYGYTSYPNSANYDFNAFIWESLRTSWDDDGSQRFACFGLTGVRTANLMAYSSRVRSSGTSGSYTEIETASYTFDGKGRVSEVDIYTQKVYDVEPEGGQPEPELITHRVIKYVED